MASPNSPRGRGGKNQVSLDMSGDESDSDSDTESVCSTLSGYSSAGGEPSCKVYIGAKLPPNIEKEHISEHFSKYGFGDNVRNVVLFFEKSTHKSKGCGYVVLTPAHCATEVIQALNGTLLLDKHRLIVRPYKQKTKQPRTRGKRSRPGKQLATVPSPQHSSFLPQGEMLNGSKLLGQRIKVESVGKKQSQPSVSQTLPQFQPISLQEPHQSISTPDISPMISQPHVSSHSQLGTAHQVSNSVIVENLSSAVSEEEIKVLVVVPIVHCSLEPTGVDINKARLQLSTSDDALKAVAALDGKSILGQTIRAYVAQLSQPVYYPVKVTHLPPHITEERLVRHFSTAGEIVSCKIHHQPGYAHVNFRNEQGARNAQHHTQLDGCNINITIQQPRGGTTDVNVPTSLKRSETVSVKVTNLMPNVQVGNLLSAFQPYGRIDHSCIHIKSGNPPYAYVNFPTMSEALAASANLHDTYLSGSRVRVKVIDSKAATDTQPQVHAPMHMQLPGGPQIESSVQRPSGMHPSYAQSPNSHLGQAHIPLSIPAPVPVAMSSPPGIAGQAEKVMKLQPDQWNQLMRIGDHGSNAFQDLIQPFKCNPCVQIQPVMDQLVVRFIGVQDAVSAAYKHVGDALNKELHIKDRVKMAALTELFPQLPADFFQKYATNVSGYHSDSSVIRLDGQPASVQAARRELEQIVCNSLKDEISVAFPLKLLCSAKKRLQMENIQSYLESISLSASQTSTVTLCSFSKSDHERAIKILTSKPYENNVAVSSQSDIDRISNHPEHSFAKLEETYLVAFTTTEDKIFVRGFVKENVHAVRKLLVTSSVRIVPLSCSPEQAQYLRYVLFEQPGEDAKAFSSSLPATVLTDRSKSSILLSGNTQAIEATQTQILEGPFLTGLLYRCFPFECNFKFLSQIKDHVLKPLKNESANFIFLTSDMGSKKGVGKRGEAGFSISIFSREPATFEKVCQQLSVLSPCYKRVHIPPRATDCVQKVTSKLERKYRTRIQIQTQSSVALHIHGLTAEELNQCQEAIEDEIASNHVVKKYIPVDKYQARYLLQGKHSNEIKELEGMCQKLHIPTDKEADSARGDDSISIMVIATAKEFEAVKEKVTDVIGTDFVVKKFSVSCPQKYERMWKRRWADVRKEQQQLRDLLIVFYSSKGHPRAMYRRSSSSSSTGGEAVNASEPAEYVFEVFGPDPEEVESVKQLIEGEENGQIVDQKQISLNSRAVTAICKGLSTKELVLSHLIVDLDINKEGNVITITAPRGLADDVEVAESQIQKFVGNRTMNNKAISCDDPVIGLILNARTTSLKYLSAANGLAKPHGISVRILKRPRIGLMLTGSQAGIQAVEPIIQTQVMEVIKANIGRAQFSVEPVYSQVLSSFEFSRFDTKLQEDLCVLCSYPKLGKQSKLLRHVLLQPSPSAHCLEVEICKGNLVHELVDVIVNAANRELKHTGGLAKAIVDAGGLAIQVECDQYVQQNGQLPTGQTVCLGAGNLPCKKIIHTVGPRMTEGNEEQLLYFAVYNSLCRADKEELHSIALPAISTGIFGVPEDMCAKASMKAVRDFCQSHPDSDIHTVRFVLFLQSAVDAFLGIFDSGIFDASIARNPTGQSESVATSIAAVPTSSSPWVWEDDSHSFLPYSPDIASLLTKEYARNPKGSFQCTINGKPYMIDFSTMKQINIATSFARRIQCKKEESKTAQWFYLGDTSQYLPYCSKDSNAIEAMFQAGKPGHLTIGGKVYTFDFARMSQINTTTNYKRPIQRRQESDSTPSSGVDEETTCKDVVLPKDKIVVLLQGPHENLKMAEMKLKEKLKALMKENTIPLPQGNPALEKKLLAIAKKHDVACEICEDVAKGAGKPQKVLKLKGLASSVSQTTSAVQEVVLNHHLSSMQESDIESPTEWQPQTKTTEVFAIPQGSTEWNRVEQQFKATIPNARIAQISRIQNQWLWENYIRHKRRLSVKNSGRVNEKELFHGTRGNNPKLIYESEDGFDMRYSAKGMWGNANYFAVNASYSNGYSYWAPDGNKEMFLVRVLTGDSHDCPSNSSLRMPPPKQSGAATGAVQLGQMKYDTVTGVTAGSRVYMTYDNDKAYPAYLIRYTG